MKKIAIINQRYGLEVNGGSELYSRQIAERLKAKYEVEVLTSCAVEYVKWQNYYKEGVEDINGGCGVVSFEIKGGKEAAEKFLKNLKLAAIETHVADARTCCLNPATSTHRQLNDEQLKEAGVPAGLIRISCGLEDKNDLIADISAALDTI